MHYAVVRAFLTKFGSHRAFLRRIDPFMTYDHRWGRFKNMPTNLRLNEPNITFNQNCLKTLTEPLSSEVSPNFDAGVATVTTNL